MSTERIVRELGSRRRMPGAGLALAVIAVAAGHLEARAVERPRSSEPLLALDEVAPVMACEALLEVDAVFTAKDLTRLTAARVVTGAGELPYCRVEGYIAPQIRFAVHLPTEGWNQRYLQNGCGGYCGTLASPDEIDSAAGCIPADRGSFVRSSTDGGHTAPFDDGMWAVDNPQAQVDLGYRAAHVVAVASKRIIETFYGRGPRYSYFTGCSDGGREGLMEAQRYPDGNDAVEVVRLLGRRTGRADGGAALPGRLRRHHCRRAGEHLVFAERHLPTLGDRRE